MEDVPRDRPVLLFDGVCNLCNRWIQFLIERDPDATFRFAPLQSDVAGELLAECGLPRDHLDSVVLVEGDSYYTKSDAVLRAAKHLGGGYRLLWPLRVVPRGLRNWLYDAVADRRYGWFGKREQCMVPTPDIESRFLAGDPTGSTEDERPGDT
jgi:predicted DCC family thiol-disulfide oxidoreductase YuxK